MKNLNFGDADSVGFFQMRVGIWNQGAYAGYPDKPELQVKWFLDQAEAVKRQRLAAGKSVDRPEPVRRVDRRRRAPRRAVPRPLPDQARRGQRPARLAPRSPRRRRSPAAGRRAAGRPRGRRGGAAAARAAGGDRSRRCRRRSRRQRARPEGDGRDPGGVQVHRHRLQVGRLDAADRVRLLGPDAVGLRAVRRADPARDLHADRGRQRHRDRRPRGAEAGRPRVLRRQRRRPPRRHVPRRRQVPPRAAHRRRGEGLVPERALLRGPVRGRAPLRRGRRRRRRAAAHPVAAAPAVAAPRRSPPPRAAAPAIDPTAVAKAQAAVARDAAEVRRNDSQLFQAIKAVESKQGRAGPQQLDDVPEGGRPVPGQARDTLAGAPAASAAARARGSRPGAGRARSPPPRRSPPPPRRSRPATRRRGVAAVSVDLAARRRPSTRATTPPRRSSPSGSPSRPRRPASRPSCRSWPRSSSPASRTSTSATATRVGFFQMRTAIWNQGAYEGYPEKPELQAKWFIDQALAIKRKPHRRGRRRLRHRPGQVRRVDRRRRAPRRAVPRPLPAAARRGPQAALHVGLQPRPTRPRRAVHAGQEPDRVQQRPVRVVGERPAGATYAARNRSGASPPWVIARFVQQCATSRSGGP